MENHAACGSLYNSRAHVHSMSRKLHVKKKRCHLCLVPAGQLAITRYYYAGTDFFNCSESKMRSRNRMEAHEIWLCVCSACANFFFFFVLHLSMTSLYQLAQIFCFAQILGAVTEDIDTHTLLLFATSLPSESICKYHGHATSALVGRR